MSVANRKGFTAFEFVAATTILGVLLGAGFALTKRQEQIALQAKADADPGAVFQFDILDSADIEFAGELAQIVCRVTNPTAHDLNFRWAYLGWVERNPQCRINYYPDAVLSFDFSRKPVRHLDALNLQKRTTLIHPIPAHGVAHYGFLWDNAETGEGSRQLLKYANQDFGSIVVVDR